MSQLKDATGNPVTNGWAAEVSAYSGSIYAHRIYIIGWATKLNVAYLSDPEEIEFYKRTGSTEGLRVGRKKHTRVIMCNLGDN